MTNAAVDKLIDKGYSEAINFAESHYENFPVISFFLKARLRKHVAVLYRFARQADDLADEGDIDPEERLEALNRYEENFDRALKGECADEFWRALNATIKEFNLSPRYFHDLLSAFKLDVTKRRYDTFAEIHDYCRLSANPVGRLILEFFDRRDEKYLKYSDSICTALQLTNFYQDVSIDIEKDRIYIPLDELEYFNVELSQFHFRKNNSNFKKLLKHQVVRTGGLFNDGEKLIEYLPGELKSQIRMTILGGRKILEKISRTDYDILENRPELSRADYVKIFIKALIMKR